MLLIKSRHTGSVTAFTPTLMQQHSHLDGGVEAARVSLPVDQVAILLDVCSDVLRGPTLAARVAQSLSKSSSREGCFCATARRKQMKCDCEVEEKCEDD